LIKIDEGDAIAAVAKVDVEVGTENSEGEVGTENGEGEESHDESDNTNLEN